MERFHLDFEIEIGGDVGPAVTGARPDFSPDPLEFEQGDDQQEPLRDPETVNKHLSDRNASFTNLLIATGMPINVKRRKQRKFSNL